MVEHRVTNRDLVTMTTETVGWRDICGVLKSVTCRETTSHFGDVHFLFDRLLSLFSNATFLFVGWRLIFTPVGKWLNRRVLKRQEKTKFPIQPGPPRDKSNSCDQTVYYVGKVECQEQKVKGWVYKIWIYINWWTRLSNNAVGNCHELLTNIGQNVAFSGAT
jgi:hypothetical protein